MSETDVEQALIAARAVHKRYGGVTALANVSLEVLPGEIHALVGENGAGKSTLVKVLTGAVTPDEGAVLVAGSEVVLTTERARNLGIGAVYQEPSLVPALTVLENIFLGREQRPWPGVLSGRRMAVAAEAALDKVGARIALRTEVSRLSVADRQLVEIARALVFDARVLIFDEPSAVLSGRELERVFRVIAELRQGGIGVLYISHRLSEIFELANRATVLKDGHVVAHRNVAGLSVQELIRLMVGRDIRERPPRKVRPAEEAVLEVRSLQLGQDRSPISFRLRASEVVGIAGLVGSGRSRLARALGGVVPAHGGEILVGGQAVRLRRPNDAIGAGIAVIPEDRKREGLILAHSIRENVGLPSLRKLSAAGIVHAADERRLAQEAVDRFGIRPPAVETSAGNLSGGNQQKVVLAKWLIRQPAPRVVILDEPTRGVDVGAKYEIYQLIDRLVEAGAGVLLISSELPEVIALSDRILVMSGGAIVHELAPPEFSEERILSFAVLGRTHDADPSGSPATPAASAPQGPVSP